MSITLTTFQDWSLHGFDNGGPTTEDNFDGAVAAMQADSWSNDPYALMQAGHYTYAAFEGIGHLRKDFLSKHLSKVASGHLHLDAGELNGSARAIAIADMCHVDHGDAGTSVSSVKVVFSSVVSGVLSVPGYTAQFWFKNTAGNSPADDWGWMSDPPDKSVNFSASETDQEITFTGLSMTLDHYFWCLYKLSAYEYPTYNYSGASPLGQYYTKDILVTFGLTNTYVINP